MARSAVLWNEDDEASQPGPCDRLYAELMAAALQADDPAILVLAGVISLAPSRPAPYRSSIHGLAVGEWPHLMQSCFPGCVLPPAQVVAQPGDLDEFDDLLQLLLEHRSERNRRSRWLAHAIATAAMGNNHLWQDLGLPNRGVLSQFMRQYFAPLAAKNSGDMKWKKFFYRQLCEQEDILICRSPHCAVCEDQPACFGQEEGHSMLDIGIAVVAA